MRKCHDFFIISYPSWEPYTYVGYVQPIDLKFKTNPEIPILHVVTTMPTNFQSKISSPGLLPAIWSSSQKSWKRAWVCMDFKNYLAWLTGIKKLIFHYNNFFGSSHFSIHEFWKNDRKNGRSQKNCYNEKSVFLSLSTTWGNFWNPCARVLFFHNFWLQL